MISTPANRSSQEPNELLPAYPRTLSVQALFPTCAGMLDRLPIAALLADPRTDSDTGPANTPSPDTLSHSSPTPMRGAAIHDQG